MIEDHPKAGQSTAFKTTKEKNSTDSEILSALFSIHTELANTNKARYFYQQLYSFN